MTAATTAAQVREIASGVGGGTSPSRGEELFRFARENRFTRCLELGFAHGVSTLYVAAALESNGQGSLTSVDIPSALEREPSAGELLQRAGLAHRVSLIIDPDSYVWWLRRRLRECSSDGRIEPAYDFVFLDGAHTWDTDGLAFCLVDRLLAPGGWILFDDLDWTPSDPNSAAVPEDTRDFAHIREVWDLLVATDQRYDELRTDGAWGYARKSALPTPQVRTVVKHDLLAQTRELARIGRSRLRGLAR